MAICCILIFHDSWPLTSRPHAWFNKNGSNSKEQNYPKSEIKNTVLFLGQIIMKLTLNWIIHKIYQWISQ